MHTSLHKLREKALEEAISYYYQNLGLSGVPFGDGVDLEHLAEHASITNFSDGQMQFEIGSDLLVSFGPAEYSIQYDHGSVILLVKQDIEEHWKLQL